MYKLVVQLVILYAIKIWVVTDAMIMVLDGFHHIIDRKIVGITARKDDGREWEWASVGVALETAGLWPIREYKRKRQVKLMEYVAGIPMYELLTGVERVEDSSMFLLLWD